MCFNAWKFNKFDCAATKVYSITKIEMVISEKKLRHRFQGPLRMLSWYLFIRKGAGIFQIIKQYANAGFTKTTESNLTSKQNKVCYSLGNLILWAMNQDGEAATIMKEDFTFHKPAICVLDQGILPIHILPDCTWTWAKEECHSSGTFSAREDLLGWNPSLTPAAQLPQWMVLQSPGVPTPPRPYAKTPQTLAPRSEFHPGRVKHMLYK